MLARALTLPWSPLTIPPPLLGGGVWVGVGVGVVPDPPPELRNSVDMKPFWPPQTTGVQPLLEAPRVVTVVPCATEVITAAVELAAVRQRRLSPPALTTAVPVEPFP